VSSDLERTLTLLQQRGLLDRMTKLVVGDTQLELAIILQQPGEEPRQDVELTKSVSREEEMAEYARMYGAARGGVPGA
jgi:hypothetical protein